MQIHVDVNIVDTCESDVQIHVDVNIVDTCESGCCLDARSRAILALNIAA